MKTIVFILGCYLPQQSANLNCCLNVIRELRNKGHKIVVLAGTEGKKELDEVDGIPVYRVHRKEFGKILRTTKTNTKRKILLGLRIIHNLVLLPFYPNTEIAFTRRIINEINIIAKEYDISCIVGSVFPSASVCALNAIHQKRKFKDIKKVGYYLDMLYSTSHNGVLPSISRDFLYQYGDRKIFSSLDLIILPEGGKEYYQQKYFDDFRERIRFVNFPVFEIKEISKKRINGIETFVYAGYTNLSDRDPTLLCDCLRYIGKNDCKFKVFGKTEDMMMIRKLEKETSFFTYYGTVDKDRADNELINADYVVAFGNSMPGVIPSKIFELFGLKKPLIYIANDKKDSGIPYVEKYPEKCILYRTDTIEQCANRLLWFLSKVPANIDDDYLKKTYYSATPKGIADLVDSILCS